MKTWILAAVAAIAMNGMAMASDVIRVKTEKSVPEVMDALQAAVEGAGATVFARIDHRAGAEKVGLELDFAQTLIFGNPKLGTPAMQADINAALYLPLKVAAVAMPDGGVALIYEDPAETFEELNIARDAKVIEMMRGALAKLTGAAAG